MLFMIWKAAYKNKAKMTAITNPENPSGLILMWLSVAVTVVVGVAGAASSSSKILPEVWVRAWKVDSVSSVNLRTMRKLLERPAKALKWFSKKLLSPFKSFKDPSFQLMIFLPPVLDLNSLTASRLKSLKGNWSNL